MSYLRTIFDQLDCWLCALLGGPPDTPISLAAARAQARGERWGCWLCWWLHQTLRQRHCRRTLLAERTTGFAAVSAAVQLVALFAFIVYGLPLLLAAAW